MVAVGSSSTPGGLEGRSREVVKSYSGQVLGTFDLAFSGEQRRVRERCEGRGKGVYSERE
jgi:hypothetical protein